MNGLIPLVGLMVAALLIATGNLVGNDAMFLAGSFLVLLCSIMYFRRK